MELHNPFFESIRIMHSSPFYLILERELITHRIVAFLFHTHVAVHFPSSKFPSLKTGNPAPSNNF